MPGLIALWDRLVRKLLSIRPVTEGSVVGYALRRYPGGAITGEDGVTVHRGEPVIELHLDSRLIRARTGESTPHQRILFLRREMLAALRVLAHKVQTDPALAGTRGVWALSLFHRGVEFLGFTVADVAPGPLRWLTTRYLRLLLSSYHPDGEERLHQREEVLVPKEIFMSRETLLRRYGGERRRERQPKETPAE